MNAETLKAAIEAMPAEVQDELKAMRANGRGLLGKVTTQMIVDRHLPLFRWFREDLQADHAWLCTLLHLHGISDPDGEPLTVGTVSSAFSRAVKAAELKSIQPETENQATTEKRVTPKRSSSARAVAPRPARRRPALGLETNGLGITMPAARMPVALERLALTPATDAPVRSIGATEIRLADQARLSLLDPSTQED